MCKRFSFSSSEEKIQEQLELSIEVPLSWSYNIAPTQQAYVILNNAPTHLQPMMWGLVPANSRDGRNEGKLINARKEGIGVSSSFRIPIRSQRCLVLADSFYAFQKQGLHDIPYRVTTGDGSLMVLAGIWDLWKSGKHQVKSFSIITKPTTGALKDVTPRMPVVIHQREHQINWMEEIPLSKVQSIIDEKDPDVYDFYKISPDIFSVEKNDSSLHQAID